MCASCYKYHQNALICFQYKQWICVAQYSAHVSFWRKLDGIIACCCSFLKQTAGGRDNQEPAENEDAEETVELLEMPPVNVAYTIRLARALQPLDRIVVMGRLMPDAQAFSVNFMLDSKSPTIAYQMRTLLDNGGIEKILHNWRNGTQYMQESHSNGFEIDGESTIRNFQIFFKSYVIVHLTFYVIFHLKTRVKNYNRDIWTNFCLS